jgi:hypothetical protein
MPRGAHKQPSRNHSRERPDHIVGGELLESAPIIRHRRELTRRSQEEVRMPGHFEPPIHRPDWPGDVSTYRAEQVAALEAQVGALEAIQPQTATTVAQIAALQVQIAALAV